MIQLYPEFFNDVFGPIMQPGSSSHTAGPCRIGYLCNSLLDEKLAHIRVEFDKEGSFAGTFGAMSEDLGALNGAAGYLSDYKDFFEIKQYLEENNIGYEFDFCSMKESEHINSMKFILTDISGKKVTLVGDSTGGGMIQTVWVNGYEFHGKGDSYVLIIYDENDTIEKAELDAKLESEVILETGIGKGQKSGRCFWYKLEKELSIETEEQLENYHYNVMKPILPVPTTSKKQPQLFDTMVEWRRLAKEQNKSMTEVAIDYEVAASGWTREEVIDYMKNVVQATMNKRIHAAEDDLNEWIHSPFDVRYEKEWRASEVTSIVTGPIFKSIGYINSALTDFKGICNVPGPMGTGGGMIYGVLASLQDEYGYSDKELLNALFIAAGVGAICYSRSNPTGEVTGCAGEMGCCTAMASAAVVALRGGTPEQMENAATLSLQSTIGWPCDQIPGSGIVACRSRALYMATMSITYAQFAMAGGDPVIPFHEEVDIMDRIGRGLSPDLLCTARGGHCSAPTAKKCIARFQEWRKTQ